jgi:SIR2-like domain
VESTSRDSRKHTNAFLEKVQAKSRPIAERYVEFDAHINESECADCRNKHGFRIPHSLIDAFRNRDVVVFAGAGISTENKEVIPYSLHEEISRGLGLDWATTAFPDAMQVYADQPNGRLNLVRKIRERLEYVDSFAELAGEASRFHDELAPLFLVDTIVTTNWDTLFERNCAAQPFILDEDMVFWESADRRVLKIHGSIDNPSTVVATRKDYDRNLDRLHKGLMGARLKSLLATKTIVFFGYSLRDEDFREVMQFVRESMGPFQRQNYIVTIDAPPGSEDRFLQFGLTPINTDGTFFLEQVKAHISRDPHFLFDELYDDAAGLLKKLRKEHVRLLQKFSMSDNPEVLYCAAYQDGLLHSLNRIVDLRRKGAYSDSHTNQGKIHTYMVWRAERLEQQRYDDVAYVDGYLAGLIFAEMRRHDPECEPPFFYIFARRPLHLEDLDGFVFWLRKVRREKSHHKGALRWAQKAVSKLLNRDLVYHHKCQLL